MTHPSKELSLKCFRYFSTRHINDAMEISRLKQERDTLRDNLEVLMRAYSVEKKEKQGASAPQGGK